MKLKDKQQQLRQRKKQSVFKHSYSDDANSGSEQVILFLTHSGTGM
jgi:hypothetical protein